MVNVFIGKRLSGRYQVEKLIGGGGMSNVYLARDMILERDVAIKMLRLDFTNNEEFVKRFQREANSISALFHPNIVNVYDVGEEDGASYIVMEYMPGPTLKEHIQQKGALTVAEALPIMEQLASALSHAHHFDIIHRDIKPQNILMSGDGEVKLTDFGIATMTNGTSLTQTNSVLGSVHYLSPEQARGGGVSKKSDIYSLGIVFFEMLTGRPPFSGESPVSIAIKHLQSETPSVKRWNNEIPQSVENIILKAMAKDPEHRYASADVLKEDIQTCLLPGRINEVKFHEPEDLDATRVLPVIVAEQFSQAPDETIIHETGSNTIPQQIQVSLEEKKETPMMEEHKEKQEKVPKKKRKWKKQIFLATFLVVLGFMIAITVFPSFFFPQDVHVPDVSGMEYEEAVQLLASEGFEIGETSSIYDDEIENGHVVNTNPVANASVQEGATVVIYQSMGPREITMENYVGQNYEEIIEDLESKFKNVTVEYEESDEPKGTIISQNPEEGTIVTALETELALVVSEGHPPRTETIRVQVPFTNTESGDAQEVEIFIDDAEHTMDEPAHTRSIIETTIFTITLTIEYGEEATYKIIRDGMTITEQTIPYPTTSN